MTERDIQLAVSYRHVYRHELVVPNVLMGWGECDLLAVSLAGYLTEYEIKISLSDLKREWEKYRWDMSKPYCNEAHLSFSEAVKNYWIVVPDWLVEKAAPLIPEHSGAGLMSVGSEPHEYPPAFRGMRPLLKIRNPKVNRKATKITPEACVKLGRKGMKKYWNVVRNNA